jgi:hypothetical protein
MFIVLVRSAGSTAIRSPASFKAVAGSSTHCSKVLRRFSYSVVQRDRAIYRFAHFILDEFELLIVELGIQPAQATQAPVEGRGQGRRPPTQGIPQAAVGQAHRWSKPVGQTSLTEGVGSCRAITRRPQENLGGGVADLTQRSLQQPAIGNLGIRPQRTGQCQVQAPLSHQDSRLLGQTQGHLALLGQL